MSKTINFNKVRFRASAIGDLMTSGRSKSETWGQTAKNYMTEVYIGMKYGRYKEIQSKYITKGLEAEEDSITLLSRHHKKMYTKNEEWLKNEFITGTPDLILPETVDDIKTSWDIFTFFVKDGDSLNKKYYWQLQSYMWLSDKPTARLHYCLTNTPEPLINAEKRKLSYQMGVDLTIGSQLFEDACAELEKEMTFDDIPLSERIITIHVPRNDDDIELIKQRVIDARIWLKENYS